MARTTLRWQIEYSEHRKAKEDMKLAGKLLHAWVTDGITIELALPGLKMVRA
jgi:hypothetical protein